MHCTFVRRKLTCRLCDKYIHVNFPLTNVQRYVLIIAQMPGYMSIFNNTMVQCKSIVLEQKFNNVRMNVIHYLLSFCAFRTRKCLEHSADNRSSYRVVIFVLKPEHLNFDKFILFYLANFLSVSCSILHVNSLFFLILHSILSCILFYLACYSILLCLGFYYVNSILQNTTFCEYFLTPNRKFEPF